MTTSKRTSYGKCFAQTAVACLVVTVLFASLAAAQNIYYPANNGAAGCSSPQNYQSYGSAGIGQPQVHDGAFFRGNRFYGQTGNAATLPAGRRYLYGNRYYGPINNRYYGPQYGNF